MNDAVREKVDRLQRAMLDKNEPPVRSSEMLDCLRGLAAKFDTRMNYYKDKQEDPYQINVGLLVAMAECRNVITEQIQELERQSNDQAHRPPHTDE